MKNLKKVPRYYIRILFILIIASMVPTVWLAGFLYTRMSDLIRTAEEETAIHYLEQISHSMELIVKNIEDTVHLLQLNNDFISYQHFKDKNYFRNFHDHYNLDRISEYSRFLKLRTGINRNLEQFATTADFIQSVYFYDTKVREVFSMEYIPTPIQSFPHREWYSHLPSIAEKTLIGPVLNKDGQKVLYMVFPERDNSDMVFIVNINLSLLYNFLWRQIEPRNTEYFFILDNNGSPLLYDIPMEKMIQSLAWSVKENSEGLNALRAGHEKLLVSSWKDDYPGWSYHGVNNSSQFAALFNQNRRFMLWILLPLLVINLSLLFLLRRLLYKPIDMVMGHVPEEEARTLDRLGQWIDEAVNERDFHEELLNKTVPAFQTDYLSRKLDGGDVPDSSLPPTDLPFKDSRLRVLAFFTEENEDLQEALHKLSQWSSSLQWPSVSFRKGSELFLVMDGETPAYSEICRLTDDFTSRVYGESNLKLFGAISQKSWNTEELYKGRIQVETALKDYLKLPFGTPVIELGRPCGTDIAPLILEKGFTENLLDLLKNGEKEEAAELLRFRLAQLADEGEDHLPSEVQHFYIHLVNSLLNGLRDRGYDIYLSDPVGEDPFVTLINLKTGDAINRWLLGFMDRIAGKMSGGDENSQARSYISTAEALIDEQLGDDISLSSIAEQMHLSTFYLSRLFKEVRNETFTEYLRVQRMKKARQLLEDRELKIKDVSRRVGYWSSNYFIKVFRKHYGVTPGEFRDAQFSLKRKETSPEP
ncbi:MAG: AraC family transcriptional regulator [Spirochaetales bacterium]|nr:AraC family transcriptional regulator [Spirochaetales bacterium]